MLDSTSLSSSCSACSSSCSYLAPDPDVAGRGVVVAFLTTSILTWICAIIRISDWFINGSSTNKIDGLLKLQHQKSKSAPPALDLPYLSSAHSRQPSRTTASCIAYLSAIISPLLLCLHDTQLASGLAISATALIRHQSNSISVYHFSVAADLSWIASGTQLVSFLFIRWDFKNTLRRPNELNGKRKRNADTHSLVQRFRALCMTIQFVLLLWQSYVQGDQRWDSSYACPTTCLDGHSRVHVLGGIPLKWMEANFILATWGYTAALLPMCSPISSWWKDFKVKLDFVTMSMLSSDVKACHTALLTKVLRTCKVCIVLLWSLLASMMLDTIMQLGWFVYGVRNLAMDRSWGDAYFAGDAIVGNGCDPTHNTEKDWGFGQIFPVVLLILPVMSLLQAYGDETEKRILETDSNSAFLNSPKDGQVTTSRPDFEEGPSMLSAPLPLLHLAVPQLRR